MDQGVRGSRVGVREKGKEQQNCNQINEVLFELQMERTSMLIIMIFAVCCTT